MIANFSVGSFEDNVKSQLCIYLLYYFLHDKAPEIPAFTNPAAQRWINSEKAATVIKMKKKN